MSLSCRPSLIILKGDVRTKYSISVIVAFLSLNTMLRRGPFTFTYCSEIFKQFDWLRAEETAAEKGQMADGNRSTLTWFFAETVTFIPNYSRFPFRSIFIQIQN